MTLQDISDNLAAKENTMKIKELSQISGVNLETIRYYEKIGILTAATRNTNGYREFDQAAVSQLAFVKTCRSLGFSIDEVRRLLQLRPNPLGDCHNADQLAAEHLAQVREKIAQLQEIEKLLETLADCGSNSVAECKLMNELG